MACAATNRPLAFCGPQLPALILAVCLSLPLIGGSAMARGHGSSGFGGHMSGSFGGGHFAGGRVGTFGSHFAPSHLGAGGFGSVPFGTRFRGRSFSPAFRGAFHDPFFFAGFHHGHRFFFHHHRSFPVFFAFGFPVAVPYYAYPPYPYYYDPYCDPRSSYYDPNYCYWQHRVY